MTTLPHSPPGRPNDAQREAVEAAERRARQSLRLGAYELQWVRAPQAEEWGATTCRRGQVPKVFLCDHLGPAQTYTTMLHELQHVADAEQLFDRALSVEEAERRAEAFSQKGAMMAGYGQFGRAAAAAICPECGSIIARGEQCRAVGSRVLHLWCTPEAGEPLAESVVANRRILAARPPARVRPCLCGGTLLPAAGLSSIVACLGCGRWCAA